MTAEQLAARVLCWGVVIPVATFLIANGVMGTYNAIKKLLDQEFFQYALFQVVIGMGVAAVAICVLAIDCSPAFVFVTLAVILCLPVAVAIVSFFGEMLYNSWGGRLDGSQRK